MPVNSYECLFLLDPTKTASDMDGVKSQLHGTLEKYGAEIIASRKWDDRKLAYPIKGQKKGIYHLTFFKADTRKMTEIDHDFRLNEAIMRHLISAIDPKWEEEMLAVARDDHRFALQVMHEESPEGGAGLAAPPGGPPIAEGIPLEEGGEGHPRRGPRRAPEADVGKE
jgi:small subunit ribosomal protein S6